MVGWPARPPGPYLGPAPPALPFVKGWERDPWEHTHTRTKSLAGHRADPCYLPLGRRETGKKAGTDLGQCVAPS